MRLHGSNNSPPPLNVAPFVFDSFVFTYSGKKLDEQLLLLGRPPSNRPFTICEEASNQKQA